MSKRNGINKHLKRQRLYESVVKVINKHSSDFIILSVRYYKWYYIIAHIISFGALLKGRRKFAHTCCIYKYGVDPRIIEAIGSGVNHKGLYDAYFNGKFNGRVVAHIIKGNITKRQRFEQSSYIEHELLGKKYRVLKAIRAWIDLKKEHKDSEDNVFCTDLTLDLGERILNKQIVGNNAEITPSELMEILDVEGYTSFVIFDSKNV